MNARTRNILLGAVGFALVCILGLYLYLTPDRLRRIVVPMVERSLERRVEIDDIGLSLWGGIAASVDGLTVHERPGFGEEPFLRSRNARFAMAFWPLLAGEADLSEVVIEEPAISYVVNEEGESNVDDLLSPKEEEPSGGPPIIPSGAIRIVDGSFSYVDRRDGTRLRVTGVDYTVELDLADGLGIVGNLDVEAVVSGDEPATGPYGLSHRIRVKDMGVEIESLRPGAYGLEAELIGRVRLDGEVPQLILRLAEQTVDLGSLDPTLLAGVAPKVSGRLTLSGTIEGPWAPDAAAPAYPDLGLTLSASDVTVDLPDLPVTVVLSRADLQVTNGTVVVSRLDARVAGQPVQVSGNASGIFPWPPRPADAPPPPVDVALNLPTQTVELAPFQDLLPADVDGRLTFSASLTGRLDTTAAKPVWPRLAANLKASGVTARTPDVPVPVSVDQLDLRVRGHRVDIQQLDLRLGRSDIRVAGGADQAVPWPPSEADAYRPALDLKLSSRILDLDELAPPVDASALRWSFTAPAHAADPLPPSPVPGLVRALDATVDLAVGRLTSEGVVYTDFQAKAVAKNRRLTVRPMSATVFGGRMAGWAEVEVPADTTANRFPFRAELDLTAVQARELLTDQLAWNLPLQGAGRVEATASGTLDEALEVVPQDLTADGSLAFENGRLVNWGLLKQAASGVGRLSFLSADTIAVKDLRSPFRVENGRVHLNTMQLVTDGLPTRISGSGGLDGSLDFAIDLDVPSSRLNVSGLNVSGLASALFGGKDPNIPVRIKVGGTSDSPSFGLTIQPSGREQVEQQKDAARQKLQDKAEEEGKKAVDKAKDLLKKKLGR